MTEQEALLAAKENVEAAMSALDFPEGSYAADEAFDALDQALQRLEAGLARCDGVDDVDALVSPQGEPGAAPEQSTDPGHPQGEGEGSPGPPLDIGGPGHAYYLEAEEDGPPDPLLDGRPLHALSIGSHPDNWAEPPTKKGLMSMGSWWKKVYSW